MINRNPGDHQSGDHVIPLVFSKDENPSSGGWNRDVIHGGNPQLATIRQMDREGRKRSRVDQLANIVFHSSNQVYPGEHERASPRPVSWRRTILERGWPLGCGAGIRRLGLAPQASRPIYIGWDDAQRRRQQYFVGDGLAGALHHERQRHDMGLTIHYQLATTGDEAHARKLVQQLRQAALDLPFQHVGEIVEFRGDQCDWEQRADDDPYRWLLIQAGTHIALPVTPAEKRQGVTRHLDVRPLHVIAFETEPGDGCEPANFGLCQYPR